MHCLLSTWYLGLVYDMANTIQVLPPDDEETPQRVQQHVSAFPDEAEPLKNTCSSIFGRPTSANPSIISFLPIGHISLDAWAADPLLHTSAEKGVYSLTSFYVSSALQNMGLGGAALRMCEE